MVYKKTTIYKTNFIDTLQYFLGVLITVLFGISLIPTLYYKVSNYLIIIILIQIILSLIRFRFVNFIIEIFLLALSAISLIPILGYVFRFIGFLFSLLDMATFKSPRIYKKVTIISGNKFSSKNRNKSSKSKRFESNNVKDAEFEEK